MVKKEENKFNTFIAKIPDYTKNIITSILNILKTNKLYIIWVSCYIIVLYPLKIIVDWYCAKNPENLDLRVWFTTLVAYFIITILFIKPIIKDDK